MNAFRSSFKHSEQPKWQKTHHYLGAARYPALKHLELTRRKRRPVFIGGQRCSHHHGCAVCRVGVLGKVNAHVFVAEGGVRRDVGFEFA
jgi:hypothetical protein